jgi:metal-responsive CopG/Arc/MetJ family transcriptional regulator
MLKMRKKIIQVPFDEGLLAEMDRLSKSSGQARAEVIREACSEYVKRIETEKMDMVYRKGYEDVPERPDIAQTQESLLSEVLEEESW